MLRRLVVGLVLASVGCSLEPSSHEAASAEPPARISPPSDGVEPARVVPATTAPASPLPRPSSSERGPSGGGNERDRGPTTEEAATSRPAPEPTCPAGYRCEEGALDRTPPPIVTEVRIEKAAHRMYLVSRDTIVRTYSVAIGWGGAGPKQREGDGVTPVGTYEITGKLDKSPWHTLLGVSYPNYEDVKRFAKLKAERKVPLDANIGFGIAIHGRRADMKDGEHKQQDWTLGCVAVDNPEIEEIARVVKPRTKVTILD